MTDRRREYPLSYFTPETQAAIRKAHMEMAIARFAGDFDLDEDEAERLNQRGISERFNASLRED